MKLFVLHESIMNYMYSTVVFPPEQATEKRALATMFQQHGIASHPSKFPGMVSKYMMEEVCTANVISIKRQGNKIIER